jgi:hypothetical protein
MLFLLAAAATAAPPTAPATVDDGPSELLDWPVTFESELDALGDARAEDGKGKSAGLTSCGEGALNGAAKGVEACAGA